MCSTCCNTPTSRSCTTSYPDPRISSAIEGWKGWLKPAAAVAFFATLAGTVFHYIGVGPNEVEEDLKENP